MVRKILICSLVVALAAASFYGCGSSSSDNTTTTTTGVVTSTTGHVTTTTGGVTTTTGGVTTTTGGVTTTTGGETTTTVGVTTTTVPGAFVAVGPDTSVVASSGNVFRLAPATADYTATISGFDYLHNTIAVPTASFKPTAPHGIALNTVVDGNVTLNWTSNGHIVTLLLTNITSGENAIQGNNVSSFYTTY